MNLQLALGHLALERVHQVFVLLPAHAVLLAGVRERHDVALDDLPVDAVDGTINGWPVSLLIERTWAARAEPAPAEPAPAEPPEPAQQKTAEQNKTRQILNSIV